MIENSLMRLWICRFCGKYRPEKTPYLNTFHTVVDVDARILINSETDKAIVVITSEDCLYWTC